MSAGVCLKCRRVVDVLVFGGDWYPPWALCPDCAALVDVPENET